MKIIDRRFILRAFTAACLFWTTGAATNVLAQDRTSVKIGYAVSKTGPNAGGAEITTLAAYQLWAKDVNEAGGLEMPDGNKLKLEIIEYDDRSSSEELVRAIQRLATQDEVDFILAPWGTGFNLAAAPLFDRYNFPQLAVAAITDKAPEFAGRWKKSFWMLGGGRDYAGALAGILAKSAAEGTINNKVAMVSVADGFGIDLVSAARPALAKAGLAVVYDKTYPVGTSDFSPMINESAATGADTFVAFSYPPDTFALTQQAQVSNFNPKVLYLGIGVDFPAYGKQYGDNANGILSLGGIDPSNADNAAFRKRHEEVLGKSPDYWGSVITYASLQMLQEAIKRKGLDREAVSAELSSGSFNTVVGDLKFEDNQLRSLWWVGQWQNGQFVGVAPADHVGASQLILPRQPWKN